MFVKMLSVELRGTGVHLKSVVHNDETTIRESAFTRDPAGHVAAAAVASYLTPSAFKHLVIPMETNQ
jgi:hypothetical protein